ncbi:hypothetical protein SeMB42_g03410 [Synchytrium endobioticum]|uniref:t-SNARE coiled-coil homology domain-containing protein n=1 Tax=Synchytrium endobioticum TaxID=286115 RepID=A0A507D755_9FUNG|nr:hypothetical protein SeLEV6574_g05225 [Synchytrium endobioticum]TPX47241.1 hypothetical protein SeMB42_g03410 [Synchytrium endobioticum]
MRAGGALTRVPVPTATARSWRRRGLKRTREYGIESCESARLFQHREAEHDLIRALDYVNLRPIKHSTTIDQTSSPSIRSIAYCIFNSHHTLPSPMPRKRDTEDFQASLLESQNDEGVESLVNKIRAIKGISMGIHDDVSNQNRLLDTMAESMDNVGTRLKSTANRLRIMMAKPHNRQCCYIVAGLVSVFSILYLMSSKSE